MGKKEDKTAAEFGAEGGKARAKSLTAEQRREIAVKAADARWEDHQPKTGTMRATHAGELTIGSITLPCFVLEDGTRVISQKGVFGIIGRTGKSSGRAVQVGPGFNLPVFLRASNLKPFITQELAEASDPVKFRRPAIVGKPGGAWLHYGYRAEILPLTCQVFVEALLAGVLSNKQAHIAEQCKILAKGFGVVGITAMIDEATGYQEIRDRAALQKILDTYLRDQFAAWAKTFPDDFYQQIFRLRGWQWKGMKVNRPSVVAHYTNDLVYARLGPGVLEELQRRNPIISGRRLQRHPQWLTDDYGIPALKTHLAGVTAIMKGSVTWEDARRTIQRAFPKVNTNLDLPFPDPDRSATN